MKNLIVAVILIYAPMTFAKKNITCNIEQPCIWLEADPNYPNEFLGYCVRSIDGNEKTLLLKRDDGHGQILPSIELNVEALDETQLIATSIDKTVDLRAEKYGDVLAGGVVIRTQYSNKGLGVFVACSP